MKYDFDQVVDRRNTNSYKWNVKENELPMWVADMDFPAAPEIRKALQERLDHGVFGYADLPEEWYDAYINCGADAMALRSKRTGCFFLQESCHPFRPLCAN